MNYFVKQFAVPAPNAHFLNHSLSTMTATKSIEGSDQDEQEQVMLALGTMTITDSVEGQDQDRGSYF